MATKSDKKKPLQLDSIPDARASLARLMNERYAGEISDGDFRALTYGFQTLIGMLKAENEMVLEKRVMELEELLMERERAVAIA